MTELIISIVALIASVLSLIASVRSFYISNKALNLQKEADKNLKRLEKDINEMKEIQHEFKFELEKNRLINFMKHSNVSEESINFHLLKDISHIFDEKDYLIQIIKNPSGSEDETLYKVLFIKESVNPYALPKMFYSFNRKQTFPIFCIQIIESPSVNIKIGSHYYLSYDFIKKAWWIAKKFTMIPEEASQLRFYIKFKGTIFSQIGDFPTADEFCKKC